MKRSEINAILHDAEAFVHGHHFALPPFARWAPDELRAKASPMVLEHGLGWDITDFGEGDFGRRGLVLFTLRNGEVDGPRAYAEKIIVVRDGQHCPMHRHYRKVEDIINRGGATLVLELYTAGGDGMPDRALPIEVDVDGTVRRLEPGDLLRLAPGESVTLHPRHWHAFWAADGDVLVGEVSSVNDDATDNWFEEPIGRFAEVDEDEPPYRLLVADYAA